MNKNTVDVLRNILPEFFIDTAAENKKQLLAMPIGSDRPNKRNHPLGLALSTYTRKSSSSYDPVFNKNIRNKHPEWFAPVASKYKRQLLAMPEGGKRPNHESRLGIVLMSYTNEGNANYDNYFKIAIYKKQPEWFIDTSALKKEDLLSIPVGSKRPYWKEPLGKALISYSNKKNGSYDPEFNKAIREKHPNWFVDAAAENKKKLLELPVGISRPNSRTLLGSALSRYMKDKKCYDPEFEKAIQSKHPKWFIKTSACKKQQLLALPSGVGRPQGNLGACLGSYTLKTSACYDPVFNKAIRARQPGWFLDTVAENKKILLNLPLGSKRPNKRKDKLGTVLQSYICKAHRMYDPDFNKAIRARQPGWFKK